MIFGFRVWRICWERVAVFLVLFFCFSFSISLRTSWGIRYSIGSEVRLFRDSSMSIFCLTQVRMKFVSSRICMSLLG